MHLVLLLRARRRLNAHSVLSEILELKGARIRAIRGSLVRTRAKLPVRHRNLLRSPREAHSLPMVNPQIRLTSRVTMVTDYTREGRP